MISANCSRSDEHQLLNLNGSVLSSSCIQAGGNVTLPTGEERDRPYKLLEICFIALVTGSLSMATVVGNILVMISIKVNRHLQTVNNYFLFSLACADLIIGVFSMNLYTVYIIKDYWPLGPVVCDLWLALDYVVSNASVMNLLIISFDRYFCVTKPLTYPARRTTRMAGLMIAAAWILSFILWAPAILFWQFIVGERTVPARDCYIQFLSNPVVTFGTAIAAFYLPVVIMTVLYIHISLASRSCIMKHNPKAKEKSQKSCHLQSKLGIVKQNNNNTSKHSLDCCGDTAESSKLDESLPITALSRNLPGNESPYKPCTTINNPKGSNEAADILTITTASAENPAPVKPNPNSMWSRIKIVTKQKGEECIKAIEIVPSTSSESRSIPLKRPRTMARKFASIARSQMRRKRQMAAREKKVTKTILAILLAFIITWTPYNVMVLINTFCQSCVPDIMWAIGYWLCYVNSTINPACYALCNVTFKKTFKNLLLCQHKNISVK